MQCQIIEDESKLNPSWFKSVSSLALYFSSWMFNFSSDTVLMWGGVGFCINVWKLYSWLHILNSAFCSEAKWGPHYCYKCRIIQQLGSSPEMHFISAALEPFLRITFPQRGSLGCSSVICSGAVPMWTGHPHVSPRTGQAGDGADYC